MLIILILPTINHEFLLPNVPQNLVGNVEGMDCDETAQVSEPMIVDDDDGDLDDVEMCEIMEVDG